MIERNRQAPEPPRAGAARSTVTAWSHALRPYRAAFVARFSALLEYRSAVVAGVATQLWWGGIKVMVLAAFYPTGPDAEAPLSLPNAITYVWTGQALFALMPWTADPDVVQAVRTGGVAYDGLRPVDPYAFWFARSAGWLSARALPRALLLGTIAGPGLRALGLAPWAWQAPANLVAGIAFGVSLALAVLLSTAALMLINVAVVALLDERGVSALAAPVVLVLSGNLLPLGLYPAAIARLFELQPLAGILDIPLRIYFGALSGTALAFGLGLQVFWTGALVLAGRMALAAALRRLEVQGG